MVWDIVAKLFQDFFAILFGATTFRRLRDKTMILISVILPGLMKKELMSLSGRNSWNLFLENLIVDWLVLEISKKYFLNV